MLNLVAFSLLSLVAKAAPCVLFDTSKNLYVFGGSQDVNLGTSSSFGSPSPKTLSSTGRPSWTGNTTQCFINQYNNIMYVLGADADISTVYVYNFATDVWSTQTTSSPPPNLGSRSASTLDHDTLVIFTLPTGGSQSLYSLDLSSVTTAASGSPLAWEAVEAPSFSTDGYTPTISEASNHILFFGAPGTTAGSADLFVIHYSYFQPSAQAFAGSNGASSFPDTSGQAFNIPNGDNAQDQVVFVPDDFSSTYVVTHWTNPGDFSSTSGVPFATSLINSTQTLPAPTSQDKSAAYASDGSALVQIDSNGDIYYMTGAINSDYTVASSATWTKMSYSQSGVSGSSSNSTSTASSSASASGSGGASASASKTSSVSGSRTSSSASSTASSTSGGASRVGAVDVALVLVGLGAFGAALL
ncbi:hypothetical protein TREMEDRAFT_44308 [Tremella mesenterica DSM 1558]|uniref:uncharacterized protein n=1 Tax=Tremella mesenterica (strain ATCC 24925 / CBS 8224 / DSM 1558 / NBRC 9311 / NRRL Y-6157 / RJB 2259-6 / UBC 559-6) TaxID=578456 RepID=UPI0003F49953|nr:uncharacterized protein TREMEDRAFT_44308 [Tremella mesenterica DSM 1558]EIW69090.1 hypothetical protein TREMEDRAFT_44308 [Tremella mesenterica DSM 1558]